MADSGEHSGLTVRPQQPIDNPFLGPALATVGVRYTASDASRETASRAVGTGTVTVPRHPMNIYYNAGTYRDEVDEYNWYYTSRAAGGGGICEDNPAVSTCIAPLPAADAAQARDSFTRYIRPLETRTDLRTQWDILARQAAWSAASDSAVAYVDGTGVHLQASTVSIPLTVPAGTAVTGASAAGPGEASARSALVTPTR